MRTAGWCMRMGLGKLGGGAVALACAWACSSDEGSGQSPPDGGTDGGNAGGAATASGGSGTGGRTGTGGAPTGGSAGGTPTAGGAPTAGGGGGSPTTGGAAATDAGTGGAPADAGDGAGGAPGTDSGAGGAGPPCPPPTCPGGDCFELCDVGHPCDEGCCLESASTFNPTGYGSGSSDFLDIAVDRLDRGVVTSGNGDTPAFHNRRAPDVALEELGDTRDDPASPIGDNRAASSSIAASPNSDDEIHVVYALNGVQPTRNRHATLTPSGWTFEDAPFSGVLRLDHAGIPTLLGWQDQGVARRTAVGWEIESLPFRAHVLSVDDDGTPYVGGENGFARRTAQGTWTPVSTLTVEGHAVAVRHGTFYAVSPSTDGDLHLARQRPGEAMVDMVAASVDVESYGFSAMAIDACGWPHAFVSLQESETDRPTLYVRWTRLGFRGKVIPAGSYCINSGTAIAVGASRVYFGRSSCGQTFWSLPLSGTPVPPP